MYVEGDQYMHFAENSAEFSYKQLLREELVPLFRFYDTALQDR